MIDVIFVLFCVIFLISGLKKGFIKRLYDFLGTCFAFFGAYYLGKIIASSYSFLPFDDRMPYLIFKDILNLMISFSIVFLCLFFLKTIIGWLIKPLLNAIVHTFLITNFINKLLGVLLSLVEYAFISYFVLLLMISPLTKNGYQLVEKTLISKHILNMIPYYTQKVSNWTNNYFELLKENNDNEIIIEFIEKTQEIGFINQEQSDNYIAIIKRRDKNEN